MASVPVGENMLSGHGVQVFMLRSGLYVLAGHAVHKSWSCPAVYPASHSQLAALVAAASAPLWTGQREHESAPRTLLKVLGGHGAHAPSALATWPGKQRQSSSEDAPVSRVLEFAGHATHELLPTKDL